MVKRQEANVKGHFLFPPDFRSVCVKAVPPSAALAPPAGHQGCNTSAVASGGGGNRPVWDAGAAPQRADIPERNYFVFAQVSFKNISSCAMISILF